jgi:GntR family transcriptional regulator/MocR family aminotransferase
MPIEQRLAILEIGRAANAWIIEDDFDGEYTFRGQPLPAMQGLDGRSRVIYVGTFAKTMFPAIRIGFLVLPEDLSDRIKPALSITGQVAPLVLQAALADFIEEGFFFQHLNRMRRLYGRRRVHFLRLMQDRLAHWLDPIDGRTGIQVAAHFKVALDDRRIVADAASAGVNVAPLSLYFLNAPRQNGLLLGYAGVGEGDMDRLFPTLERVLRSAAASGQTTTKTTPR